MTDVFQPLDLKASLNSGTENIETADGYLWPAATERPGFSGLHRLPGGDCRFRGVPFALGDRKESPGEPAFIVVSGRPDERIAGSASIAVGRKARRLLFAHVCAPVDGAEASLEGTGRVDRQIPDRLRLRTWCRAGTAAAVRDSRPVRAVGPPSLSLPELPRVSPGDPGRPNRAVRRGTGGCQV